METAIELHDSELSAVTFDGGLAVVSFSPAYIHHAGSGWLQSATLIFRGALSGQPPTGFPVQISDGFLRIGDTVYDNVIPANGSFAGEIEFSVVLETGQTFNIMAQGVSITLLGERAYLEPLPWATESDDLPARSVRGQ